MFTLSQTTMGAKFRPGALRSPYGQSVIASDEAELGHADSVVASGLS